LPDTAVAVTAEGSSGAGGPAVREALASASAALTHAGCETPRLDAELLLCAALGQGWSRARLVSADRDALDPSALERYQQLLARRRAREPVAYIVGFKDFRRIRLAVDPRVLIPRAETELLVEVGLTIPRGARVADAGTGSGAVALALKDERPDLEVTGIDVSADALDVARENARRLGLDVGRDRRCRGPRCRGPRRPRSSRPRTWPSIRRSLCASSTAILRATPGWFMSDAKLDVWINSTRMSVVAVTVAERGLWSRRAISPTKSPRIGSRRTCIQKCGARRPRGWSTCDLGCSAQGGPAFSASAELVMRSAFPICSGISPMRINVSCPSDCSCVTARGRQSTGAPAS